MAERAEPIRIGVRELRGKLADYLRQAQSGARFLIVSHGQPVAELGAPADAPAGEKPPRKSACSAARSGWPRIGTNGPKASSTPSRIIRSSPNS